MRVARAYIETSVFNFVFADDAPEKRQDTLLLFDEIRQGKYKPYTSDYVLGELLQAPEPKQSHMLALVQRYDMVVIPASAEARQLAEAYVREGIIPQKHMTDALHIAAAAIHDIDVIVSYNFKHIVKLKTVTMTEIVNLREGYRRIGIFSPTEVIDNGE